MLCGLELSETVEKPSSDYNRLWIRNVHVCDVLYSIEELNCSDVLIWFVFSFFFLLTSVGREVF